MYGSLGFCYEISALRVELRLLCAEVVVYRRALEYTLLYAAALAEDIADFDDVPTPAILPIPSAGSDGGFGMKALHDRVKRAVGSDIL